MKKLVGFASMVVLSGSLLAGCGDEASSTKKEDTKASEQTQQAATLDSEVAAYKDFATEQLDQFVLETEAFVEAVKAGDVEKAKELYAPARMYFERSEPIAESFGDLDPRIDARLADIQDEGKGEEEWSGYHKLEYALWEEGTTEGYEETADQLLKDVKELRAKVETVEVTPDLMITGAVDLLNEVSTSKISGEEEIYSHTDLYDFKANVEGAEKIFAIFKDELEKKDKDLVSTLEKNFATLDELLAKYEDGNGGYVSYEKLTSEDTKALSRAVDNLGEPLSQIAIVVE
ncbi:iron uptake system protein EfeO [Rossellomorea oryzaecorticis]|jgi:iron uptake system component EfeO|uniref:Iron uptake system protein EfeO n=1 Tax=Rossellomorea oryzaecorticis TaxID=1396505 RepID=A0ABW8VJD4_9BACI|nr:iron uptake system protein EfeO [[Bacillus] enclensis]MBH9966024.1 EfeM/EfeO family lipoprotein [[Bacillus] enclensis]QTC41411.1 EfeM/EfeO family lipoprotein [Bacillus sp. V3]